MEKLNASHSLGLKGYHNWIFFISSQQFTNKLNNFSHFAFQ